MVMAKLYSWLRTAFLPAGCDDLNGFQGIKKEPDAWKGLPVGMRLVTKMDIYGYRCI